jgi:undecaprenyl diphosphate synthase
LEENLARESSADSEPPRPARWWVEISQSERLARARSLCLDPERIPTHVAIVMDGNGRWAEQRGLPRTEGHRAGELALLDCVEGALEIGISYVTVFAFSTENWKRPKEEVDFLMDFARGVLERRREELCEKGVRIVFSGRRERRVPKSLLEMMDDTIAYTRHNSNLVLQIAVNYGGRAEIVDAAKKLALDALDGKIALDRLDEKRFRRYLYNPKIPDPDLVIRTSGEVRISNFLLWEAAYSELVFLPILWPDFTRETLWSAVREYQQRERRFGGISEASSKADKAAEKASGGRRPTKRHKR